jgi:hypothetical protein
MKGSEAKTAREGSLERVYEGAGETLDWVGNTDLLIGDRPTLK